MEQPANIIPIVIKPTIGAVGSTDNTPKKYKQNVPRPEAYSTINLSNCFIVYNFSYNKSCLTQKKKGISSPVVFNFS